MKNNENVVLGLNSGKDSITIEITPKTKKISIPPPKSIEKLKEIEKQQIESFGSNSLILISTLFELAKSFKNDNIPNYKESQHYFEKIFQIKLQNKENSTNEFEMIRIKQSYADLLDTIGKYEESLKIYEECRKIKEK